MLSKVGSRMYRLGMVTLQLRRQSLLTRKMDKKKQETEKEEKAVAMAQTMLQKIDMYERLTPAKWEEIHKVHTEYTIFEASPEVFSQYGSKVYISKLFLGCSVGLNLLGFVVFFIPSLPISWAYLMPACFCSIMGFLSGYYRLQKARNEVVVKIMYDTATRKFGFTTFDEKNREKLDWVMAEEIGVLPLGLKHKRCLYYNKLSLQKYATVGQGTWVNEELFLGALLQARRSFQFRPPGPPSIAPPSPPKAIGAREYEVPFQQQTLKASNDKRELPSS